MSSCDCLIDISTNIINGILELFSQISVSCHLPYYLSKWLYIPSFVQTKVLESFLIFFFLKIYNLYFIRV